MCEAVGKNVLINKPLTNTILPRLMDDEAPDPFADLFSSSSSTDLFRNHIKSTSTSTNATVGNTPVAVPGTPTGTGTTTTGEDDFGSFISVPPSLDPLHQPEPFSPIHPTSPVTEIPSLSFVEAAKLRHGENERRVLGELLMHQDDPLYWITSSSGEGGERSGSPGEETEEEKMKSGNELIEDLLGLEGSDDGNDEGPPSPPPSPRGRTPVRGGEEESESHSRGDSVETDDSAPSNNNSHNHPHHHHHSHSSDSSGGARKIPRRISHSSGGAGAGGTLSRKFTSFLSSSLPSPPSPTSVDSPTTTSFSHSSTNIVRALTIDSTPLPSPVPSSSVLHTHRPIPNVTHRNPFSSSHLPYSPPTGAPGFVPSPPPDHRLEKSKAEQMGPVVLKGRKESTSMVLTSELAQTVRGHPPLPTIDVVLMSGIASCAFTAAFEVVPVVDVTLQLGPTWYLPWNVLQA